MVLVLVSLYTIMDMVSNIDLVAPGKFALHVCSETFGQPLLCWSSLKVNQNQNVHFYKKNQPIKQDCLASKSSCFKF